ncbi:hypothetical protein C8J56DRAFT_1035896 [Mycena floridula]|nr:hypothetical protein C8J56DRAFT_1035896 [Mycena floridula]
MRQNRHGGQELIIYNPIPGFGCIPRSVDSEAGGTASLFVYMDGAQPQATTVGIPPKESNPSIFTSYVREAKVYDEAMISQQLANGSQTVVLLTNPFEIPFSPSRLAVLNNIFWFLSLALSLTCAALLDEFMRNCQKVFESTDMLLLYKFEHLFGGMGFDVGGGRFDCGWPNESLRASFLVYWTGLGQSWIADD